MKERLTGAIILVVLVVALVPELLSGPKSAPPPKPISTADGTPIRSVIIHLSDPVAAAGAAGAADSAVAAPASAPAPTVASTSAPTPALTTAAPEPLPTPPAPAPAAPSPQAEPAEVPTPAPPPARATGAAVPAHAAPARPAAPPASPVTGAGGAAASGGAGSPAPASFLVQAGMFSNRANANRLVQDLTTHGLEAHLIVQKKGATELYQVRVGPAGDRAAASALLGRVKAAGSGGVLVPAGARSP